MIEFTENAIGRIKKVSESLKKEGFVGTPALRISIQGGGCAGFQYKYDMIDWESRKDEDMDFELEDIYVVVDPKSLLYLVGSQVDYTETLMESSFVVNNPQASSVCGCGVSFTFNL